MRDVGDSIDELKVDSENFRGGVVPSLPFEGLTFVIEICRMPVRCFETAELWKPDLADEGLEYFELQQK